MNSSVRVVVLGRKSVDLDQDESFGFLVDGPFGRILLDCGPYVPRCLRSVGINCSDVDAVIVSHAHIDHSGGLAWLINSRMFEEYYKVSCRISTLDVVVPTLSESSPIVGVIRENFDWMVKAGQLNLVLGEHSYQREGLLAEAFAVSHTVDNVGIQMNYNDRKIVYISDTNLDNVDDWKGRLNGASIVIVSVAGPESYANEAREYGFTTVRRAAELCREAGVGQVLFFHLFDDADHKKARTEAFEVLGMERAAFPVRGDVFVLSDAE